LKAAIVVLEVLAISLWLVWMVRAPGRGPRSSVAAGLLALGALAVWAWLVVQAPVEAVQGPVQKILYVHVPNVIPTYLGFVLTAVAGVGFLWTRREAWDALAVAGAEVGIIFCSLILVTGPIWAKPVWGHWWAWDLRLTSTLVLWFIYVAYLLLRAFSFGSGQARTFTAIYGIAGTAAIPFVYFAVKIARGGLHPDNPAEQGLPPSMAWTLFSGHVAFLLVFAYLAARRLQLAQLEARLEEPA
jgi:heme exporter protein C